MKRILMAIMAVAVAVTFSAPAFAQDKPKEEKKDKKDAPKLVQMLNADDKDKKAETKPKEEKKAEKK
jgi:Ni/Co efflux regulator RcnB